MRHHLRFVLAAALLVLSLTRETVAAPAGVATVTRESAQGLLAAGYRGQGVKVAVLDQGFRGYRDQLGRALPARVTTCSFRADGDLEAKDSRHGVLCAEIIHTLAPDAEILLANWEPENPEAFVRAVRWTREQGARVISCSMIMPSWGDGDGGGRVHAALAAALGNGLFFASAGNVARRNWGGEFSAGAAGFHEWVPGRIDNALTPYVTGAVTLELSAPEPSRFELLIVDPRTGETVARSEGRPLVRFAAALGQRLALRVRAESGAGRFHVVASGADLEFDTEEDSVPFPGDGPEVVAVGAVDQTGRRLAYSACGHAGKPDLAAAVPWPSAVRGGPFGGTSAAAPQAAALAALLWSAHGEWSGASVRSHLERRVLDGGVTRRDGQADCAPAPSPEIGPASRTPVGR